MFIVVCCLGFFQNQLLRKILSGIPSECQTDWIQIRPDLGPWVQTVCKGYQQTTLVGNELNNRVKNTAVSIIFSRTMVKNATEPVHFVKNTFLMLLIANTLIYVGFCKAMRISTMVLLKLCAILGLFLQN